MYRTLDRRRFLTVTGAGVGAAFVAQGLASRIPARAALVTPAYRAFKDTSPWNQLIPTDAPLHASSAMWIADFKANSGTQYLKFSMTNYATPLYWAKDGDPQYTITPFEYGKTQTIRIPQGATPAGGNDGQLSVFDLGRQQSYSLHHATFSGGQWRIGGIARYDLNSNGLDYRAKKEMSPGWTTATKALVDDPENNGHRGIPPSVMQVRRDEIAAGSINHKMEMFAYETFGSHYFPMVGHESGKGGIIPEGALIRIKPSVNLASKNLKPAALVVATAIQKYGLIVGDNSGSGNRLKAERANWTGIMGIDDLKSLTWDNYEFITAGFYR